MIRKRQGVVQEILDVDDAVTEILVEVENKLQKAVNYNQLTGPVSVGDKIIVNTSAVYLNLGTGGYHFVIHNYNNDHSDFSNLDGHIMKLRYTPMQLKCLAVEEPQSPYHKTLQKLDRIDGMHVLIGSLHSMLSPAAHILKHHRPGLKIAYIMTDSACLAMPYSKTVKALKRQDCLTCTITCGQAFGGDYEAINIYTALLTARHVCQCDVALITPGPGVVGTQSLLGFSGVEEGHIIDAVNTLKGVPIFIPRVSFADPRERHRGMSHHTLTILSKIAYSKAYIAVPVLEGKKHEVILDQIKNNGIDQKHRIRYIREESISVLEERNVNAKTMGRNILQDPDFFSTVGAAAALCLKIKTDFEMSL